MWHHRHRHLRACSVCATTAVAVALIALPAVSQAPDTLAALKSAVARLQGKQPGGGDSAITILKSLQPRFPKIADYLAWIVASSQFDNESYTDVAATLAPVWTQKPVSPLIGRATLLAARADLQLGHPRAAIERLRGNYEKIPQPRGDLTMAAAFAADNDPVNAVAYNQRVYYGYPASMEAAQAEAALATLRDQLADRFPPALGRTMLARATRLLELGQPDQARKEFIALSTQLTGAERDLARVKIGVADYDRKQTDAARNYLETLEVEAGEADAERLHYLLLCARRRDDRAAMNDIVDRMARQYPASHWRLESLWALANLYLTDNQADNYEPLYRACYESFPKDSRAAECHWKVAWSHYLRRASDAGDYLRAHISLYPASENVPGALYFLARLAEGAADGGAARVYYNEIVSQYPSHYYTSLARERLAAAAPLARPAVTFSNTDAGDFLRGVVFPSRLHSPVFQANALAQARIDRARLLAAAGLDDWAETELRYAAQYEDQPQVIAMELATEKSQKESFAQGLRYVKRYASDYLHYPMDAAPTDFWHFAFPLPYRADMERSAKEHNLDIFLLAGLARQESEFDPKAVSVSSARGLTQIMPATGRQLSRTLQLKAYNTARLFQPAVNLQLGAYYLRSIADQFDGHWEAALAGYNAGPNRVKQWLTWADFREPAEFVETIPYAQTRNYVQIVLRNAELYRRIYAPSAVTEKTARAVR
jgi:soluble lytic murein transglycosylase